MQLGTKHIAPGAVLAPMAGVTDLAFRTICAEHGASMTVSEMVSSRALVYQDKKSLGLMKRNPGTPFGVQLFEMILRSWPKPHRLCRKKRIVLD